MPPLARWSAMAFAERFLRGDVERGRRLVENPHRTRRDEQTRQGDAAFLPGRKIADREIANARQPDLLQAPPRATVPPAKPPSMLRPEFEIFETRSAPPSSRRRGRCNGPVRPAARHRRRREPDRAVAQRQQPGQARRSVDLPAPLRPSTTSASPARNSKSTSLTMARPPRSTRKPRAERLWGWLGWARAARFSSRSFGATRARFSRAAPQLWFV